MDIYTVSKVSHYKFFNTHMNILAHLVLYLWEYVCQINYLNILWTYKDCCKSLLLLPWRESLLPPSDPLPWVWAGLILTNQMYFPRLRLKRPSASTFTAWKILFGTQMPFWKSPGSYQRGSYGEIQICQPTAPVECLVTASINNPVCVEDKLK